VSLNRYAKARDTNEAEIVRELRAVGATVVLLDQPVDLLVGFRGRNFLLEVKQPIGPRGGSSHSALTSDQIEFFQLWRGEVIVVRSPEAALQAITA
jgi:hypothetical protein